MTVRILLLSFHYPPDLASFRIQALVEALLAQSTHNVQIDVVTTHPCRYPSHYQPGDYDPPVPGLSITRIAVPKHRNGLLGQACGFCVYAFGVRKAVKNKEYDVILGSSSRLMTAALAGAIAHWSKTPLYLDIRDIFVDVLPELFPGIVGKLLASTFTRIERLTVNQASRVNLISPGFLSYFMERYPNKSFSTFTHGVDELFLEPLPPTARFPHKGRLKIVYAGNIGTGQGLEKIIPQLAEKLAERANFYIIGHGGTLKKLRNVLERRQITNVELIAPTPRTELLHYYRQADVLFLHLNTFKAFFKVIPSKLFEYAATGKPILAGLEGYAKHFTVTHIPNASVFTPADLDSAVAALTRLHLGTTDRSAFVRDYARTSIQHRMALDILGTGSNPPNSTRDG